MKKADKTHEVAKAVREALDLLAAEESAKPAARETLRTALELARQSLETPARDDTPRSCFAPPPLLFRIGVAAFMEGLASTVAALALIVVVLALAFGKTHAPEPTVCSAKCTPLCEPAAKREGGNG